MTRRRFGRRALSVTVFAFLTTTASIGGDVLPALAVTGGSEAPAGSSPWIVSILVPDIVGRSHTCGGAILSPNKVLTAAHGVSGKVASDLTVKYGSLDRDTLVGSSSVRQVVIHSRYSASTGEADLAVLTLREPVQWDQTNFINLPPKGYDYKSNQPARVVGWGPTAPGGAIAQKLHSGTTKLVTTEVCAANRLADHATTADMVCSTARPVAPCKGDDGGPLVVMDGQRAIVIGVAISRSCADPNHPGVYTRTVPYIDWINQS